MTVPQAGRLVATADPWEPYQLLDPDGVAVEAVAAYLRDLQAADRSAATLRSYGMDLLRWFRPVGGRGGLGPGHAHRGAGLLPLAAGGRQADPAALAHAG
jgi:hypothetical protein